MAITLLTGTSIRSGSIPVTALGGGVLSSSAQIASSLPGGTVSSSAQIKPLLPDGTVSSSAQINVILDLDQVVSSSGQVKDLLPGGTVSASGQVDITATTGYATFSSSVATKNDVQDVSIGALNAATSSYAINSTIQGQLAGVASSSAQVKAYLPDGTVSASGQVDITATTGYGTFSSSLATVDAGQTTRIDNLASLTSSYAINSTIQSQLAGVASSSAQVKAYLPDGTVSSSGQVDYNSITNKLSGVVSSSAQVKPLLPDGTLSSSTQVNAILDADGVLSSSAQVVVQNTTGIGAIATTGSNVFTANQTITGSLFISQNLVVQGSSSISYISQSTLNIGTNKITVNTDSPSIRFGGLDVIDSGSSPQRSGSIYFDSLNDQWIFVHANTAGGVTSSVIVMGPPTFNNIGGETLLTQNRVLKSNGLEHITDSQISDNGVTVSITNGLSVGTNLTASNATISGLTANQAVFTDANDTLVSVNTTGTGDVVRAASPTLTGTLTAANITGTGTILLAGIPSSSAQVKPLLPGGTVTSSAASSPSQGTVRISINGVDTDVDTGLQTGDSPTLTGLTVTGLTGNQAVFTNGSDVLVSNAVTGTGNVVMSASPTLTGTVTANNIIMSGSQFSGIVSGSGTQYRLVVPVGTNFYAT